MRSNHGDYSGNDAGAAGSIAIGVEDDLTKGFAEEWPNWTERRRAEAAASAARSATIIGIIGAQPLS